MSFKKFEHKQDNDHFMEMYNNIVNTEYMSKYGIPNDIIIEISVFCTGIINNCIDCNDELLTLFCEKNITYYQHIFSENNNKILYFCGKCCVKLKCIRCFNGISLPNININCKFHCFRNEGPMFINKKHFDIRNNAYNGASGFMFPCCNAQCMGKFNEPESQHNGCNIVNSHLLQNDYYYYNKKFNNNTNKKRNKTRKKIRINWKSLFD